MEPEHRSGRERHVDGRDERSVDQFKRRTNPPDVTGNPPRDAHPRPEEPEGSGELEPARITCLVIDDNIDNQDLIEEILMTRYEVRLLRAGSVARGLELATAEHPDVTVLDLHLPGGDGSDLLRVLRSRADTSRLPVIVVSAETTPSIIERVSMMGALAYLTKPFKINDFLRHVEVAIDDGARQ